MLLLLADVGTQREVMPTYMIGVVVIVAADVVVVIVELV
jgi:hypothetical protein